MKVEAEPFGPSKKGILLRLSEPPPSCNRIFVPAKKQLGSGKESLFIMKSETAKVWSEELRWRMRLLGIGQESKPWQTWREVRDEPIFGLYLWRVLGCSDYSNRTKLVLDALEGFVYKNDRNICGAVEFRLLEKGESLIGFVPISETEQASKTFILETIRIPALLKKPR